MKVFVMILNDDKSKLLQKMGLNTIFIDGKCSHMETYNECAVKLIKNIFGLQMSQDDIKFIGHLRTSDCFGGVEDSYFVSVQIPQFQIRDVMYKWVDFGSYKTESNISEVLSAYWAGVAKRMK